MAEAGLATLPTPDHITLLLKCHKSTVLLSVLPTEGLPSITDRLLRVLRSRNLDHFPGSEIALPENSRDLELGTLIDRKDPQKGWRSLESKPGQTTDVKNSKKKASGRNANDEQTAASTGLADGSWLAFRLRTSRNAVGEAGDLDIDIDEDEEEEEEDQWDVVVPSFDDADGEEAAGGEDEEEAP